MKGHILNISETELLIRADDNNKYVCHLANLKSDTRPQVGDLVDFEVQQDQAVDVYILRAGSQFEHIAQNAKETANAAFKKVRSHISEENAEKAKAIGKDISAKASTAFADIKSGKIKIQNKYAIFSLVTLFICGFFPLINAMGATINFYQVTDSIWMAIFAIASVVVAYLGVKPVIYRAITAITLLLVLIPTYNGYSQLSDAASIYGQFGGGRSAATKSLFNMLSEVLAGGIVFMLLAVILVAISLLPGMYRAATPEKAAQE